MTISTETVRIQYSGNGVTTTFAYTFPILEDDDLAVIVTDAAGEETELVLNSDYTVTGAGGSTGGNVVLTSGATCASGETLTIIRQVEATQETDYVDGESLSAASFEAALDKTVMVVQQLKEQVGRSVLSKRSSTVTSLELPDPEGSKYIGWNSGATSLENKDGVTTTTGSTLIKYMSNYSDFATAMAAIGSTATTLVIDTTANVTTDTTIPSTLHIRCEKIGSFFISAGKTLAINGPFEAGAFQCFSGSGNVVFGKGAVDYYYAEWWGAVADNSTACHDAFIKTATAVHSSGGGTIQLSQGVYKSTPISFQGLDNIKIKGVGRVYPGSSHTTLYFTGGSGIGLQCADTTNPTPTWSAGQMEFQDFYVDAVNIDTGINGNLELTLRNVSVMHAKSHGIIIEDFGYPILFDNVQSLYNNGDGLHILGPNTTQWRIHNSEFSYNGGYGVYIEGAANTSLDHTAIQANERGGLKIYFPSGGLYLERLSFYSAYFEGNGTLDAADPLYAGNYTVEIDSYDAAVDRNHSALQVLFINCGLVKSTGGKTLNANKVNGITFINTSITGTAGVDIIFGSAAFHNYDSYGILGVAYAPHHTRINGVFPVSLREKYS